MDQMDSALLRSLARAQSIGLAIGAIALVVAVLAAPANPEPFFRAYLLAFVFWLGMALGCFALVLLYELAGGRWGTAIIRFLEAGMNTLPLFLVLFIPLALGLYYIYPWTNESAVNVAPTLQQQSVYLNTPFFLVRALFYLVIWIGLAHAVRRWSFEREASPAPLPTSRLQYVSALGLVAFGLTGSFAMVDWIMSLEPHWYSTIYAAMVLMAEVLGAFALAIVLVALLDLRSGTERLAASLFNDLGSLLLAFVMLWAYLGFSQFLIIYAGNLEHEIPWYLNRLQGGWEWVGLAVALLQFFVPFVMLLFRGLKRNPLLLMSVALLLVFARLIDTYWLIKPAFSPARLYIDWLDLVLPIALGGLWLGYFLHHLKKRPLLPASAAGLIGQADAEFAKERMSS